VFVPMRVETIEYTSPRLARMVEANWNPRESLILESKPDVTLVEMKGTARIVKDQPNHVVNSAEMQTEGFVLLADAWDPGWRATVNGTEAKVWCADQAFRAVEVPAGGSTIEFRYCPASFRYGCYGALLGAIGLVGGNFVRVRAARKGAKHANL